MKRMRKCNDEIYQLAQDQTLVKKLITDGHVTIFKIKLQTLMKLVGQAKYPST
jgi:hypothetical protein